jgi:hypothetical protein
MSSGRLPKDAILFPRLAETGFRLLGESSEVRVALVSFGFVFIHPFVVVHAPGVV